MIDVPVEVKDALREGSYRKNYRVVVLATDTLDQFTIDNNNLIKESVHIDERMVSGDTLKFGLCEGSSLEFQYFGKENITGRQLQVFCDVSYEDAGTGLAQGDSYTVDKAGNYEIFVPANTPRFDIEYQPNGGLTETIRVNKSSIIQTIPLNNCGVGDVVSFSSSNDISVTLRGEGGLAWYEIPMGFFTVKKCSRQASTGIIKVTAYNKLQSDYLDAKANTLIEEIASDGAQNDYVSVNTIIAGLLNDYKIEEKIDGIEYVMTGRSTIVQIPSVKLKNQSATYKLMISSENTGVELDRNDYAYKILVIKDVDKYCDYIEACIDELYQWVLDTFQNAETLWDNTIKPILITSIMPVIFSPSYGTYSYAAYSPSKYITSNTVTALGVTYNMRPLNSLYRIVKPTAATISNVTSLWQQLFSSAWVLDSNNNPVQGVNWTFDDVSDYNDNLPRFFVEELADDGVGQIELNKSDISDVTLRELQSAVYETQCQFGQLSRETDLFSGVELNHSRLLPADTLYPATALYPNGAQESAFRSQYSKLWADEGNVHKWRYLIITYKGLDGEGNETDYTLQRTINNDGTDDYNCSDNWLFRNLVWTEQQIGLYASAMVAKMQGITWFPFEMWAVGLPYLETGDEIEIPLGEEVYTSYILQRQLKGIQNLQDTYINGTLDIY